MVENTSKDVKQIPFEFREDDSCVWKDVVDGFGDFVEPSWHVGYQYRRKPEPEVVKPKWPETTMTSDELDEVYGDATGYSYIPIANAAIAHSLETGQVVLPNISISSLVQSTNYKKDAEEWGGALNEAAWTFIEDNPEKSALLFNTCKTSLRAAILRYLERVEGSSL